MPLQFESRLLTVVHSPDDQFTDFAGSEALLAAATGTADTVFVTDLDGADHNVVEADTSRHGLKYVSQVIRFLDERLAK